MAWRGRACALGTIIAAGCGGDREPRQGTTAVPDTASACRSTLDPRPSTPHFAVQLGSFADSGNARRLARALESDGFVARSRQVGATGRASWRVLVLPGQGAPAARLAAHAMGASYPGAHVVTHADTGAPPSVELTRVNRGTPGMMATTRWSFSPDGCAMLVVEDPAAVEAEPIPNGFVYVDDAGGAVIARDSVWDMAPSPDWRRLAYSRGWRQMAGERDSLSDAEWSALARRVGLPVDTVRRGAFSATGMAIGFAVARPVVLTIGADSGVQLPLLGGWRLGWTAEGQLAVGLNPRGAQDFSPPAGWLVVSPETGELRARADSGAAFYRGAWHEGPTVDISIPAPNDTTLSRPPGRAPDRIRSRGGWIEVRLGGDRERWVRVVPGVALATTRAERSVAALVPWPEAKEYDPKWQLVVLRIE